jgi:hypothetical protein
MEEDDPFWTHDTSHLRECSTSKHGVTRERTQTYSQSYSAGVSACIYRTREMAGADYAGQALGLRACTRR